jgi:uncharacterized SAM-binding protein YcdF (DUF218 family)
MPFRDADVSQTRCGKIFQRRWRLTLLSLIWIAGLALWIVWVGSRDDAKQADAVIVLGAAAYDAFPSPVFEQRIRHGIDLYRRRLAPVLIFTGGFGRGARFAESEVAKRFSLRENIPVHNILIETVSRDTRENIAEAAQLMRSRGLARAIIVSDPLHMSRALRLCAEISLACEGSPTPTTRYRGIWSRARFLAKEVYFFHRDLVALR